ncbi:MAG: RHS repeat domain-containing protein, partial [Cyclobacteriaceae bacterium]
MALDHQGVDNLVLSKYYAFGDFERETDANGPRQLHYIAGGDGLAAIYVKYDTGADSMFYIMQDHLGSLVGAINAESNHVYRQSFDAWGRKRNPQDWSYNNIPDNFPFLRGYTGHEHLKWFGLINMNGRMYDASLCRFLSPDPYVQMPDNLQNFNRYSYCLNNPLVYTDPSGEIVHLIIGAAIGGTLNWIVNGAEFSWEGLGYFGIGALAGGLSAGVGAGLGAALAGNAAAGGGFAAGFLGSASITSTGFVAGAITGGAAGFTNGIITGTANGMMDGQKFSDALKDGGIREAIRQTAGGAFFGGISGGIDAVVNDRHFVTGSPKQEIIGNENDIIALSDYKRFSSNTNTKNAHDVFIPDNDIPFKMEIKVEGMNEITDVVQRFPKSQNPYLNVTLDKNTAILDFPIGVNSSGHLSLRGWRWYHNSKFKLLPQTWIYSRQSNYAAPFFFLDYLTR